MKKLLVMWIAAFFLLSITGCAGGKNNSGEEKHFDSEDISPDAGSHDKAPESSEGSDQEMEEKTLVVYYSATGTTERVARSMADMIGADLFAIEPETEYTPDDLNWTDKNSRVSREHDYPESREMLLKTVKPTSFESYRTVLIGYPIWWGIAAWPVDAFVKGNDFTGKTVIPFCTAASSDIGESGQRLSDMAGTGEWAEGKGFYSSSSDEEISRWLDSLNIK
ncbi:MAG: flavodoxin [Clostridiales bacterium]|nr:flavodoxin [Clostridiales bacterium]